MTSGASPIFTQFSAALSDRYRIERELGRGGTATVYLAHDINHDRKVAIKVLDPDFGPVLGAERFLSEVKVTANLRHPNLLPLFDSGEAIGVRCLSERSGIPDDARRASHRFEFLPHHELAADRSSGEGSVNRKR